MRAATLAGLLIAAAAAVSLAAGAAGAPGSSARGAGRIFFSSNRAPDLNPELFTIGRDGRGRKQLTPPTTSITQTALSPDGTRVVGWQDGLVVVDANGKHRRQLTANTDDDHPIWSPDGTKIAFTESLTSFGVIGANGGTPRHLDSILPALLPAWSPDSSELAYAVSVPSGIEIRAARADGSSTRLVTTVPATSAFPLTRLQWAPPGKRLVFSTRDGIYSVDAAGGAPVPLTHTVAYDPLVSPDGKRIAFEDRRDGNPEIWVMNADGSGQTRLSTGFYLAQAWAPNGSELAVLPAGSTPSGASVQEQIYRLATDGSGAKVQVTHEARGTTFGSTSWTPDGSRLLYTAQLSGNDRELYSMRPDGRGLRQLTRDLVDEANPALSPDGRRLAFDRVLRGKTRLYLMRPGGGGVRPLAGTGAGDSQAAWSPDGKRLAFVRTRGGSASIDVVDLRTRHVRRIAAGIAPSWSPNGLWIAFASGVGVYAVHPNGRGRHLIPRLSGVPVWSPNGRQLAGALFAGGHAWLGVEAPTGRQPRRLARVATVARPAWRADGRVIVFADGGSLYSVRVDGSGGPRPIDRAPGITDGLSS